MWVREVIHCINNNKEYSPYCNYMSDLSCMMEGEYGNYNNVWIWNIEHHWNESGLLGASGSVWQLSDKNCGVVKSLSLLEPYSAFQVHLGEAGSADHQPGSTWVSWRQACVCQAQAWEHLKAPATSLGVPTSTLGAWWITLKLSRKKHHLHWECCWCAGKL